VRGEVSETDVRFPWIHIKESLVLLQEVDTLLAVCPFVNNTPFNHSLVMNAYARLPVGSRQTTMLFSMSG
jgi:hypothetical protein